MQQHIFTRRYHLSPSSFRNRRGTKTLRICIHLWGEDNFYKTNYNLYSTEYLACMNFIRLQTITGIPLIISLYTCYIHIRTLWAGFT